MTASNLQLAVVSTYAGYNTAKDQLERAAARLGLELVGWGALPIEPPKVKIDPHTWTIICPHCGEESEDLEVIYVSDSQVAASPVITENEDEDEREDRIFRGYEDVGDAYWSVPEPDSLQENADRKAYCCLHCSGWLSPVDEMVVS
jgi:hypothetical protein